MNTTCRSCGADVIWAQTSKGRHIPLDAVPASDGNILLTDGIARVVDPGQGHFVSHFVTCPQAHQWRKPA